MTPPFITTGARPEPAAYKTNHACHWRSHLGVQFNDWSRDCGPLLAPKVAGPEARAARERPPLRGLENVQSTVSAMRTRARGSGPMLSTGVRYADQFYGEVDRGRAPVGLTAAVSI